jgi:hypothetical protein
MKTKTKKKKAKKKGTFKAREMSGFDGEHKREFFFFLFSFFFFSDDFKFDDYFV